MSQRFFLQHDLNVECVSISHNLYSLVNVCYNNFTSSPSSVYASIDSLKETFTLSHSTQIHHVLLFIQCDEISQPNNIGFTMP